MAFDLMADSFEPEWLRMLENQRCRHRPPILASISRPGHAKHPSLQQADFAIKSGSGKRLGSLTHDLEDCGRLVQLRGCVWKRNFLPGLLPILPLPNPDGPVTAHPRLRRDLSLRQG